MINNISKNIQIIIKTHSLYIIYHILNLKNQINNNDICLNMISTAFVENNNYNIIKNPQYEQAYKELTLNDYKTTSEEDIHQIDVLCEDETAKDFIDKIIKTRDIRKYINYITNLSDSSNLKGNSYTVLTSLCINGPKLLENSIVVFDADVSENHLNRIKHFDHFIKLPDEDNLPIEKRIVKYIIELSGDDDFFFEFESERAIFLTNFTDYNIRLSEDNYKDCNVKPYKKWAESDLRLFKKIVTYYIRNNEDHLNDFRSRFINLLNEKLIAKSLPIINE